MSSDSYTCLKPDHDSKLPWWQASLIHSPRHEALHGCWCSSTLLTWHSLTVLANLCQLPAGRCSPDMDCFLIKDAECACWARNQFSTAQQESGVDVKNFFTNLSYFRVWFQNVELVVTLSHLSKFDWPNMCWYIEVHASAEDAAWNIEDAEIPNSAEFSRMHMEWLAFDGSSDMVMTCRWVLWPWARGAWCCTITSNLSRGTWVEQWLHFISVVSDLKWRYIEFGWGACYSGGEPCPDHTANSHPIGWRHSNSSGGESRTVQTVL